MSRQTHRFVAAFLVTCILMTAFCGFLLVDRSSQTYGLREAPPLFYARAESPLSVSVGVMGQEFSLPMGFLNQAAGFFQHYYVLIPRPLRLAAQWVTVGAVTYEEWRDAQIERDYQQSIQEEP